MTSLGDDPAGCCYLCYNTEIEAIHQDMSDYIQFLAGTVLLGGLATKVAIFLYPNKNPATGKKILLPKSQQGVIVVIRNESIHHDMRD